MFPCVGRCFHCELLAGQLGEGKRPSLLSYQLLKRVAETFHAVANRLPSCSGKGTIRSGLCSSLKGRPSFHVPSPNPPLVPLPLQLSDCPFAAWLVRSIGERVSYTPTLQRLPRLLWLQAYTLRYTHLLFSRSAINYPLKSRSTRQS